MPTSDADHITAMLKIIMNLNPSSIMDVGCGFGKWGFLCREYLDIRNERYFSHEWKVRIDAVEIYHKYITSIHRYVYDKIHIQDIRTFDVEGYDLVILGDVIEHLGKDEAINLINSLIKNNKNLLISTPDGLYGQEPYKDNVYEIHKCGFNIEDFKQWNAKVIRTGIILIVHITK